MTEPTGRMSKGGSSGPFVYSGRETGKVEEKVARERRKLVPRNHFHSGIYHGGMIERREKKADQRFNLLYLAKKRRGRGTLGNKDRKRKTS